MEVELRFFTHFSLIKFVYILSLKKFSFEHINYKYNNNALFQIHDTNNYVH